MDERDVGKNVYLQHVVKDIYIRKINKYIHNKRSGSKETEKEENNGAHTAVKALCKRPYIPASAGRTRYLKSPQLNSLP